MKKIDLFKDFKVNEAMGIAHATTFYVNRMVYIAIDELYKFVDRTRNMGRDVAHKDSVDIVIGYSAIRSMMSTKDLDHYKDFPVSEIIITFDLSKRTSSQMTRDGEEYKFMVGGYASPFARGRETHATRIVDPIKQSVDHSLSVHLGIELIYGPLFRKINTSFPLFEDTKLFKKIESVILHEMNHLYEIYNRKMNRASLYTTALTWSSIGENVYGVPKLLFDLWRNNFTNLIYYSEPHEVNAQVQEAKTWVDRMNFNRFKSECILWKSATKMEQWDYKKFVSEFTESAIENGFDKSLIDFMKDKFIEVYINNTTEWKEFPSIDPWKLKRSSTDDFFKIFENKIKKSGKKLVRNFARLYALKNMNN